MHLNCQFFYNLEFSYFHFFDKIWKYHTYYRINNCLLYIHINLVIKSHFPQQLLCLLQIALIFCSQNIVEPRICSFLKCNIEIKNMKNLSFYLKNLCFSHRSLTFRNHFFNFRRINLIYFTCKKKNS
jgi:hypothetical protein